MIFSNHQILLKDKIEEDKLGETRNTHLEKSSVYIILDRKPKFVRPKYRSEDRIIMDIKEIICKGYGWIYMNKNRVY